ncbi:nuclear transport factor 2 family protein [Hoeflea sp. TYP-13]|uniref:nuclear transport factor 2 family protein n=1 Tax=Hoeflea sp. TYP-13 TaxID=3230023 RepID=UPI0034C6AA93
MITRDDVIDLFAHLETGHADEFFQRVAEDVQWTVMGTHPLAGTYTSKEEFLNATFRRLDKILEQGVRLKVTHTYLEGSTAIVEMESLSVAKSGKPFNNIYCWIVAFNESGMIVGVRAYVDTALVKEVIDENEPHLINI